MSGTAVSAHFAYLGHFFPGMRDWLRVWSLGFWAEFDAHYAPEENTDYVWHRIPYILAKHHLFLGARRGF